MKTLMIGGTKGATALFCILAAMLAKPVPSPAELTVDPSFGVDGYAVTDFGAGHNSIPRDLVIQPDGSILTAGLSYHDADTFIAMTRHSPDGVPDSAGFGVDGKVLTHFVLRDQANAIALQADGKIVAAGMQASSTAGSAQIPSVYRFNADGSADLMFADGGYAAGRYDGVSSGEHAGVAVVPGGYVAAGRCNANASGGVNAFGMKRYLPDGTQDLSARREYPVTYNRGSVVFYQDGRVLWATITFVHGFEEFVMARADSAGDADLSFGVDGLAATGIHAATVSSDTNVTLLLASDGKILLAGTTFQPSFLPQFSVFRFHPDGSLDTTFGTAGRTDVVFSPELGQECHDAVIDDAGRILLAGEAYGRAALARLLPDGGMDSTFAPGGKFWSNDLNTRLFAVEILPDGKIVAAGGYLDFFLVRYMFETTSVEATSTLPAGIQLAPNPSRGGTVIQLQLERNDQVQVEIFDAAGRRIRRVCDNAFSSGPHDILWDGRDDSGVATPAGTYFARVVMPGGTLTRKLIRIP